MSQNQIIELIIAGYKAGFTAAYRGHAALAELTEAQFDKVFPEILDHFETFAKKAAEESIHEIQMEKLEALFRAARNN